MNAREAKEFVSYDPDTGVFRRLKSNGGVEAGSIAGHRHNAGYVAVSIRSKHYLAHRLAWLITYGAWPEGDVDHINGDRADNRLVNLRVATRVQNMQNRKGVGARSKSGLLGASPHRDGRRWVAHIRANGKNRYLGLFDTAEQAHQAYMVAKAELHPFSSEVAR